MRAVKGLLAAAMVVAASGASVTAQQWQPAPLVQSVAPVAVDSGFVFNTGRTPRTVFSTTVQVPGASWLRLSFDDIVLSGDSPAGTAAYVRLTSVKDGHQQVMDFGQLQRWRAKSAYFNGDAVIVDLVAFPGTGPSRISMSRVLHGDGGVMIPDSICGSTDDRVLSQDKRVGRLWDIGCTAWLIDDAANCFLTAGHCITNGTTGAVVQFNVPLSTTGGNPQNPSPNDQYPVDPESIQSNGGGSPGSDYAYLGCFANGTGKKPFQAQGEAFSLAPIAPPLNTNKQIRVTGYGSTTGTQGTPLSWNLVQKTHAGPYAANQAGTWMIGYGMDTTGGNSGSPVIDESTGLAIGIHTHGGCTASGGFNQGTNIGRPQLLAYLNNPKGVCVAPALKFSYPNGLPTLVNPDGSTSFQVRIQPGTQSVVAGSEKLFVGQGSGFVASTLTPLGGDLYVADMPTVTCNAPVLFYVSAIATDNNTYSDPSDAPNVANSALAGVAIEPGVVVIDEDFENGVPSNWIVSGLWHLADGSSACSSGEPCQGPAFMYYGLESSCTYNTGGSSNSGALRLPTVELAPDEAATLEFCYRQQTEGLSGFDFSEIWVNGEYVATITDAPQWTSASVDLSAYGGQSVMIEFVFDTIDPSFNDFLGLQLDGVKVTAGQVICFECYADCDQSGTLTVFDYICFSNAYSAQSVYADCDKSGTWSIFDYICFSNAYGAGCP